MEPWKSHLPIKDLAAASETDWPSTVRNSWSEQIHRASLSDDYIVLDELRSSGKSGGWSREAIEALCTKATSLALELKAVATLGFRDYGRGDIDGPAVATVYIGADSRQFKVFAYAASSNNYGDSLNNFWPITMIRELHPGGLPGGKRVTGFPEMYAWYDTPYASSTAFWFGVEDYESYLQGACGLANRGAPYWQTERQSKDSQALVTWLELTSRALAYFVPELGANLINASLSEIQSEFAKCVKETSEELRALI